MTASFPAVRLGRLNGRFGNTVFLTHDGPFPVVGQGPNFLEALMKMELALYQALMSISVPEQKAHAVIEAMESDMHTLLATKSDLANLEHRLTAEIAKADVRLTIRMGVITSAAVGIILTAMKFIH